MEFLKLNNNAKLKEWFEMFPVLCLLKQKIPTIQFSDGFRLCPSSYFLNYTIKNYEGTLKTLDKYLLNPLDSELSEAERTICHDVINGVRDFGRLSGKVGKQHGRARKR